MQISDKRLLSSFHVRLIGRISYFYLVLTAAEKTPGNFDYPVFYVLCFIRDARRRGQDK